MNVVEASRPRGLVRVQRCVRPSWTTQLLNPDHELAAAWVSLVDDEAGAMSLDLIQGQRNRLGIELGVVEKSQLPKPTEVMVTTRELARKPVRHGNMHYSLRAARVKDDGVEGVERCMPNKYRRTRTSSTLCHVEEWLLICEALAQEAKLGLRHVQRCRCAVVMTQNEHGAADREH